MTLYTGTFVRGPDINTWGTRFQPFSNYPPQPETELHLFSLICFAQLPQVLYVPAQLWIVTGGDDFYQGHVSLIPSITQSATKRGQKQWFPPLLLPNMPMQNLAFDLQPQAGSSHNAQDTLTILYTIAEEPAGTWGDRYA